MILSVLYALLTHRYVFAWLIRRALVFFRRPPRGIARIEIERAAHRPLSRTHGSDASIEILVSSLGGAEWRMNIGARDTGIELKEKFAEIVGIPESEVLLVPPGAMGPIGDEDEVQPSLVGDAVALSKLPWSFVRLQRRLALSGSKDGTLKLWDVDRAACINTFQAGGVVFTTSACWRRRLAVSGCEDGRPRLWDFDTGKCADQFGDTEQCKDCPVFCIDVDWACHRAASGSFGMLHIWDLDGGPLQDFRGGRGFISCVCMDWASRLAVSGSADQSLRIWDLSSGRSEVLLGHKGAIFGLSVDWTGMTALSASGDSTLRLWDLGRRVCTRVCEGHTAGVCAVAADWEAKRAVSGSSDFSVRLWDLTP